MKSEIQKADKQEILSPLDYIDRQIGKLLKTEMEVDQGWANVGILLQEVSVKGYWRHEYESFNDYLNELGERHRKGRTQLYHYFSTVKALAEFISPANLNEMGIAKASELRKAVKHGLTLPKDAVEAALKPTNKAEDIRKMLWVSANPQNGQVEEKGIYHDLGGIYCSEEQWLVISSARESALHTDPVCKADTDWGKTLDWLLKLSMEWLGTHGGKD